jgi:hypothetical protein
MSDFLSKLIARSFTDALVIQPRVPSLFEPTAIEFFDEPQSSAGPTGSRETIAPGDMRAPVSKLSHVEKPPTEKSIANASDSLPEVHPAKPAPGLQAAPTTVSPETKRLIVALASAQPEENHSGSTKQPSESFSKSRTFQSLRRKDFSQVEQGPSTSEPIIRVTIGRVEVRAVHPPVPMPKPVKPAPPRLSLEDYLRKRARGSR